MWRQAIDGMKIKAASWMALEKQRVRVCDAAKEFRECPGTETMAKLKRETKRLEAMERIQ